MLWSCPRHEKIVVKYGLYSQFVECEFIEWGQSALWNIKLSNIWIHFVTILYKLLYINKNNINTLQTNKFLVYSYLLSIGVFSIYYRNHFQPLCSLADLKVLCKIPCEKRKNVSNQQLYQKRSGLWVPRMPSVTCLKYCNMSPVTVSFWNINYISMHLYPVGYITYSKKQMLNKMSLRHCETLHCMLPIKQRI